MNTDKQPQALAQDQQGHSQCTAPWTSYCIFSYHTEIEKHILINFNYSNYYQNKSDTATCIDLIVEN
jgi:hypothetical protein